MHVMYLSWRDRWHPESGGAEIFLEETSTWLAGRGHEVTVVTARYPGSPADEMRDGRRFVRRGGRLTVYGHGFVHAARHCGDVDVIIDVQNGVPFWSPVAARSTPVVNLMHHVHREQWPEAVGPVTARVGWLLESRLAPAAYRRSHYVTVSQATHAQLVDLGIAADRISVVLSGLEPPTTGVAFDPAAAPSMVCLGRLVPHKRVDIALRTLAALRDEVPGLTLDVLGQGYHLEALQEEARDLGIADRVRFAGFVGEQEKADVLRRATVSLLPSLKEGWGLSVVEAGALGTPTVAFRDAGGVNESIVDGVSGFLADDEADFVDLTRRILVDAGLRDKMGEAARRHAARFDWASTSAELERVLERVVSASGSRRTPIPPG